MSILTDISSKRKTRCIICGTNKTYYDKIHKMDKWYKSQVVGQPGFWCRRCYQAIYTQKKLADRMLEKDGN